MPATEIAVNPAGKVGDKEMLIPTGQQGAVLPQVQDRETGKLKAKVSVKDISTAVLVKGIKQWAAVEEKSGSKKSGRSSKSRKPCRAPAASTIALFPWRHLTCQKLHASSCPRLGAPS